MEWQGCNKSTHGPAFWTSMTRMILRMDAVSFWQVRAHHIHRHGAAAGVGHRCMVRIIDGTTVSDSYGVKEFLNCNCKNRHTARRPTPRHPPKVPAHSTEMEPKRDILTHMKDRWNPGKGRSALQKNDAHTIQNGHQNAHTRPLAGWTAANSQIACGVILDFETPQSVQNVHVHVVSGRYKRVMHMGLRITHRYRSDRSHRRARTS